MNTPTSNGGTNMQQQQQAAAAAGSHSTEIGIGKLYFFAKAAVLKGEKNSQLAEDIFTHRFLMMTAKKCIADHTEVIPVDSWALGDILPMYGLKDLSYKLPFLLHIFDDGISRSHIVQDDPPQIEGYLEKFPPSLESNSPQAVKVLISIWQRFMHFFKATKGSPEEAAKLNNLLKELGKIDEHLVKTGGRFLTGNSITALDCNLLPKLYYLRVAGKYFKQFEIPSEFVALKRYIEAGDLDEAFQESRCSEREILEGFSKFVQR